MLIYDTEALLDILEHIFVYINININIYKY